MVRMHFNLYRAGRRHQRTGVAAHFIFWKEMQNESLPKKIPAQKYFVI